MNLAAHSTTYCKPLPFIRYVLAPPESIPPMPFDTTKSVQMTRFYSVSIRSCAPDVFTLFTSLTDHLAP